MVYWLSTLITVLVVYIAISIALYYLQDYMLFKPEKLPKDFQFIYDNQDIEKHNLETRDGATIIVCNLSLKKHQRVLFYILKGIPKVSKAGVSSPSILLSMAIRY